MEEKTLLFAVLGVVTVVAVIGVISAMNAENTGLVYGGGATPGAFYRGLAARQMGSGEQSAVANIGRGVYVTAGTAQSPSAGSSHDDARIPTSYSVCFPRDNSGNFVYDAKGNLVVGMEVVAYEAAKSTILKCTANYFTEISPQPDHVCCAQDQYKSGVAGGTGAAYSS